MDAVEALLEGLERVPERVLLLEENQAEIRITERQHNLYTQFSVGPVGKEFVASVVLPALHKDGWISVTFGPAAGAVRRGTRGGTSKGGDRTRFDSQEAALAHSRDHVEKIAQARAEQLLHTELDRIEAEILAIIETL